MFRFVLTGFSDEISAAFQTQLDEVINLNIAYIEIRGVAVYPYAFDLLK